MQRKNFTSLQTRVNLSFEKLFLETLDVLNESNKDFFGDGKIREKEKLLYQHLITYDQTYLTLLCEEALNFRLNNKDNYYSYKNGILAKSYTPVKDDDDFFKCSEIITDLLLYTEIAGFSLMNSEFYMCDISLLVMKLHHNEHVDYIVAESDSVKVDEYFERYFKYFRLYQLKDFETFMYSMLAVINYYSDNQHSLDSDETYKLEFNLSKNTFCYTEKVLSYLHKAIAKKEQDLKDKRERKEYIRKRLHSSVVDINK